MKRILLPCLLSLVCLASAAQEADNIFKRTIYNNEYDIYITMNFYSRDVVISGQEFMGALDGFLGDNDDFRKWLILDAVLVDDNTAEMDLINAEGSEDLHATLTYNGDGTYTLRQGSGATIKIARRQKWVKLPKKVVFTTTKTGK